MIWHVTPEPGGSFTRRPMIMCEISGTRVEAEEDISEKNLLNACARTRLMAEQDLMAFRSSGFEVTALRPLGVCVVGPHFRVPRFAIKD